MPRPDDIRVTLAEIARIAGVGRAAVSNWRRRHEDFPAPVGGTDASPEFLLDDVAAWLRRHGKLREVGQLDRLWPQLEALGERSASGAILAAAARPFVGPAPSVLDEISDDLTPDKRALVAQAMQIAEEQGPAKTFDYLFSRWLETYVRQVHATPETLARLMVSIAAHVLGQAFSDRVTVFDPACGTGGLLAAAANIQPWRSVSLVGVERDVALAGIAAARVGFAGPSDGRFDIRVGDSLRADPCAELRAEVAVSNPPWNEREWGHELLVTDSRWVFGLPPRTESELAWIEHALARLRAGGIAVLLMPPAVASRRAGRRIRSALLRSRALRGIIALPQGMAQPLGIPLHLWILQAPTVEPSDPAEYGAARLFMMDASGSGPAQVGKATAADWQRVAQQVLDAVSSYRWEDTAEAGSMPELCAAVPLFELLDQSVDLAPTRFVHAGMSVRRDQLSTAWDGLASAAAAVSELLAELRALKFSPDAPWASYTTVAELEDAGALTVRAGAPVDAHEGPAAQGAVPVLTAAAASHGEPSGLWVPADQAAALLARTPAPAVAREGDVVVVGIERVSRTSWVHEGPPAILGPQLSVVEYDSEVFDPWFLAGSLGAASNTRQASIRATSMARIDVRRLRLPQAPISQQRDYGMAFKALDRVRRLTAGIGDTGGMLVREASDLLASGSSLIQ